MEDKKKLQQIELNILKEVIKVFEKHQLKYFALGGTMLGAVRHKGFIPWDDDIDIGMPRKDYEKFCDIYIKELPSNLKLRNFKTDISYRYYISRILDLNYKLIEKRNKDVEAFTYVSIDIFPLDGLPTSLIFRKLHQARVMYRRMKMSLGYFETLDKERERNIVEKIIINFFKIFPLYKFIDSNDEKKKIDKLLKKYDIDNNSYCSNLMGAYRTKETFKKEVFSSGSKYDFEDISIMGPHDSHCYLEQMYGDYMKIPSSEEILTKEHFEIIKGQYYE
ncbi:LicD family protein [Enterococcus olivae]